MSIIVKCLIAYAFIDLVIGIQPVWMYEDKLYYIGAQLCNLILLFLISIKSTPKEKLVVGSWILLSVIELIDDLYDEGPILSIIDYLITFAVYYITYIKYKELDDNVHS